ncbi:453bb128-f480-489b-b7ad-73767feeb132 [Sclerotinia trifoliorum]|uniref:453bb128-f480-489b-b7ad-73767feeb132 n=1 Tax=Sclerotinia trifoliorum TaxID=28548 RepID=A0A8H2W3H4_9HELO|nr:453bb128-f480-489b-b7ad-73767feeb132 [Sclerotinia trifoliorum]
MRASFTAIVTGLMAFNVAALPGGSPTWGNGAPCAGSKYTCASNSILSVLTCTNILNNVGISIPIILKERDVEERAIEARTYSQDGDYCCTSSGLLTLSCLNVLNNDVITLPIIV